MDSLNMKYLTHFSYFQSRSALTAGSLVTVSLTAQRQITMKRWAAGSVIGVVPLNMRSRDVVLKWILPWVRVERDFWTLKVKKNLLWLIILMQLFSR